ncbi:hypothetical protein Vadar_000962 [Vaccinium darrowii]|uniref:Uncharacterized protein n=1 Tax=Vaccinium darrowii TaxID=229202 RepID=A0ACB7XEK0_9ERIC|nr:hypothetical protein Vadar_000962 [Vaccinium darrowii]
MAANGELFEIFSRIPAKAIFKFAYVSRFCNEFSSEDYFVENQSRNVLTNTAVFMQQDSIQKYAGNLDFHVLRGEKSSSGAPKQSLEFLKESGHMLGSSNGLACCRHISKKPIDELFLCNPATRKWLSIPDQGRFKDYQELQIVFQCNIMGPLDEFPSDYFLMVVHGTEDWSSDIICNIYSPTERIWQERGPINFGARRILFESFVYQKGVFYFLSDWFPCLGTGSRYHSPYIVVFDPEKASSRFLQIPKPARKHDFLDPNFKMGIFKWGQGSEKSLCLVTLSKGVFTIWARNPCSESWKKTLKVRTRAMRMVEHDPHIAGFTIINGNTLLVATSKRVYQYSVTSEWRWRRAEKVGANKCGDRVLLYPYSNTLRPCGDGAAQVPR